MEFKTAAQKACYEKVVPWMKELFGELAMTTEKAPVIGVVIGSALAQTFIYPWGDDDATICTRAYVVTGAELTPDLMHYLLRENDDMRFGAFGVDKDNDIFFEHTIVGSTCDKNELKASVIAVVRTADIYDDQIIARWGGQRAIDRMQG
jgi:hypothetical protein